MNCPVLSVDGKTLGNNGGVRDRRMKDVQGRCALVMATGAVPSQPHISSQSHLVDRGSLTQSLRVPEEPVDSSSTRPCCYGASAMSSNTCAVVLRLYAYKIMPEIATLEVLEIGLTILFLERPKMDAVHFGQCVGGDERSGEEQSRPELARLRRQASTSGDVEEEAVGGQQPSSRTATSAFVQGGTGGALPEALQNDLQQATNVHVHVSAQTVRNRLHEGGMKGPTSTGGGCAYSPTPMQDVWHLPENTKIGKFATGTGALCSSQMKAGSH
ncbi:hypothetical protein L3Q82_007959 [Scortum barcoo]|uniref:Uncharacterized protein n=1 Tax=Scortum barcoo TaxID=214431 RepID=A0ACB8WK56_9TELE|nr:hypothetical protein L3Q82_007959 [Scortum barcoo]